MPMTSVMLRPGVDTQKTLSANEAGVSVSQLLRYRGGLLEAYGGWEAYVSFTAASTVRALHPWQDAASDQHLAMGGTNNLSVITAGSNYDITPQTATVNFAPNFSINSSDDIVTVVAANSSGYPSIYNTVYFNTPVALGTVLLSGAYQILSVLSTISFTISASANSTISVTSSGILPIFNSSASSPFVDVTLPNNNYISQTGLFYQFIAPTSVGGITVEGPYEVKSVTDSTTFRISATTQASATATATMNSSQAQIVYSITIGPQAAGSGFGGGGFGGGGFGTGTALTGTAGSPITADDWTLDNWGSVLIACPEDGPIYTWSANSGTVNSQVITTAPFFNGGIFISMPQQVLVAYRSCQSTGVQDNLLLRWCDQEDYTNWTVSNQTTAGSFKIPTGSRIVGAMQGPLQGTVWTDVDAWVMRWLGQDPWFNLTRVGNGCGLVGPHAMGSLSGNIYWMGLTSFHFMSDKGVTPLPCAVWDFVFQNINSTYLSKVCCATNAAFGEVVWFFPSETATENDSYVKYNITESEWDYGTMSRTAWCDVSILGEPIGTDISGNIFQHETGTINSGVAAPSFTSGWWAMGDGNEFTTVDFVIPDFKWGTYSGSQDAQISLTFNVADYPGDTPRLYGPYAVTSSTQFLNVRFRGRLLSVTVRGDGLTFWRLGRIRLRLATSGRR